MNSRVFEIIRIISDRVVGRYSIFSEDILDELVTEGFKEEDIEEAITWIEAYQKQLYMIDDALEFDGSFKDVEVEASAHYYLTDLIFRNIINQDYMDEILRFGLLAHNKGKLNIDDVVAIDRFLKFGNKEWAEEALANFKAYNLKKDC